MIFNPTDFLHSLAKYLVARAAAFTAPVTIEYAGTPRQLWRERVVEDGSEADPYTVMKLYGGPPLGWYPEIRLSVQFQTVATEAAGDEAGLNQAWTIFRSLIEEDGHPLRMVAIDAYAAADDSADGEPYTLVFLDPQQRPGMLGRDDRGRGIWTWNAAIGVKKNDDQS